MRSSLLLVGVLSLGVGCTESSTFPNPQPPPPPPGPSGPLVLQRIGHGNHQVDVEGRPLPGRLEVMVTRGGVPQGGIHVEWTTTSGSLSVTRSTTGFAGTTFARLTLGNVLGDVQITARILGEQNVAPVVFRATALERLTGAIDPVSNHQSGEVGTALATPLRIRVTRDGVPRAGILVTWQVSFGALSTPITLTDVNGDAEATWTLGTSASLPTAVARIAGVAQPLEFQATAIAGPPEQFSMSPVGDLPANDYQASPAIRFHDRYGNAASHSPIEWLVISGPATIRWADSETNQYGWSYAGLDPTGTQGNIRVRVRSLINNFQHTFTFNATEPSYRIQIYEDIWDTGWPAFFSTRNWTYPVADTIPVGTTVTWYLLESDIPGLNGSYIVEAVGAPNFSGGIVQANTDLSVFFAQPGTYRYRLAEADEYGTLVVQ